MLLADRYPSRPLMFHRTFSAISRSVRTYRLDGPSRSQRPRQKWGIRQAPAQISLSFIPAIVAVHFIDEERVSIFLPSLITLSRRGGRIQPWGNPPLCRVSVVPTSFSPSNSCPPSQGAAGTCQGVVGAPGGASACAKMPQPRREQQGGFC